jgi:uncharacterized protein DUF1877
MSMNATFVQVDATELTQIQTDPSMAETLFQDGPMIPPVFAQLDEKMRERVRTIGPQMLANQLSHLDPGLRQKIEARLGQSTSELAGGKGGDAILKLMQERDARASARSQPSGSREKLSLEKEWHGVHFVLCGQAEPGADLLSQVVMGGVELGEDDEGFSGYGPARFFPPDKVAEIAKALSHPGLETEAAARFDADRMTKLKIYPGWRASDSGAVMDALRRLRIFYLDAASKRRAIVTCLV